MGTREDLPLQRATDAEHKPADEREGRDGEVHDGNRKDRDGDAEPDSGPESASAKPVFPGERPDLDVGLSGLRAEARIGSWTGGASSQPISKEEACFHVLRLHDANQVLDSPPGTVDARGRHRPETVQQAALGRGGGGRGQGGAPFRELDPHEPPVVPETGAAHQAAALQSMDQERGAALVHQELPGQFANGE